MARPLRVEYPGAWYHVTSRGSDRTQIFRDDRDRQRFLEAVEESIDIFNVEVHCYVLMSNHFHFLLRTKEANLGRFMQRFNTAYTGYFNLRHQRAGHLYQGRYKAILVDADEYLLEVSRYLHLNPVRLKEYEDTSLQNKGKILRSYPWSSLRGYLGLGRRDKFVTYGVVLGYMGGDTKIGRARYGDFVVQGLAAGAKNILEDVKADMILGADGFVEWVRRIFIEGKEWRHRDYPDVRALRSTVSVKEIAGAVGKEYGMRPEELLPAWSKWHEARQMVIELSYRLNFRKTSLQKLGLELGGIGGDAIAHNHARIQKVLEKDAKLLKRINLIERKLRSQHSWSDPKPSTNITPTSNTAGIRP